MKMTRWIFLSLTGLAILLTSVYADTTNKTFRTTGLFYTFTNSSPTAAILAGHNLANLAAGRSAADPTHPNQVLALTFLCDSNTTNITATTLVVYDANLSSNVATIATASLVTVNTNTLNSTINIFTNLDTVVQAITNRDNQVRFLAQFQVNQTGDAVNGLLGGYLIVAGRIHANRTNGCPESVSVNLDYDRNDRNFGDQDVPRSIDPDSAPLKSRTGLAHCVGVIYTVENGITVTNLIPLGQLSIRSDLPVIGAP